MFDLNLIHWDVCNSLCGLSCRCYLFSSFGSIRIDPIISRWSDDYREQIIIIIIIIIDFSFSALHFSHLASSTIWMTNSIVFVWSVSICFVWCGSKQQRWWWKRSIADPKSKGSKDPIYLFSSFCFSNFFPSLIVYCRAI